MVRFVPLNPLDAMRIPIVFLAAALTLAACGTRQERTASVEPRNARSVRLYGNVMPRCPYREVGTVSGRMVQDIQRAAFSMRANAVLMESQEGGSAAGAPLSGIAIQFLSADCRR